MRIIWKYRVLAVLVVGGGFLSLLVGAHKVDLEGYARSIVEKCSSIGQEAKTTCYDDAIAGFSPKISLEASFSLIRLVQGYDPSYAFCHGAGHKISANAYKKDPSKWRDVVGKCPTGICSNGCIHGAITEHFRAEYLNKTQLEDLMPTLETLCEKRPGWEPTGLEQASCYHEIGHVSLYVTNGDVVGAGAICEKVAVKGDGRNYLRTCNEGIFMQVFEPRDPDDFALIYNLVPWKDRIIECERYIVGTEKGACWKKGWGGAELDFCGAFKGDMRYACIGEAWVINDSLIESAEGIESYCANFPDYGSEQVECRRKMYYALMSKVDFNEGKVMGVCEETPAEYVGNCFASVALRMIETDKTLYDRALKVCESSAIFKVSKMCFLSIDEYASFALSRNSIEYSALCAGIPDSFRIRCK